MRNYDLLDKHKVMIIFVLVFLFIGLMSVNYSYSEIIPMDRRINWNPGVEGGIPTYPVVITATNAPYNADSTGTSNASSAIQNAINDCSSNCAVYLPEGVYRLDSEISIENRVVLRGAGPHKTKLKINGSQGIGIRIGGWFSYSPRPILSGYTKGSTSLTLSNTSGLSVGDIVLIQQQDDLSFVTTDNDWCSRNGRNMGQIVEIDSINGNTITIDPPISLTLSAGLNPELTTYVQDSTKIEYAGIEDLYIERVNPNGGTNVQLQQCKNCWIKNIESYNAYKNHVVFERCFRCEIRDSYIHHAHFYGDGGYGYGISLNLWASETLVENNILYRLRHMIVLHCSGSGNVISYNYSDESIGNQNPDQEQWLQGDFLSHNSHPHMNLFEGNKGNQLAGDFVHGSASHQTYLRNFVDRTSTGVSRNIHHVNFQRFNRYMNVVGNILGQSGDTGQYDLEGVTVPNTTVSVYRFGYDGDGYSATNYDPEVKITLLRHGNYDYINNKIMWDPTIIDHNLPNSLYLKSKPAFFKDKRWPPFGPDLNPMTSTLPAEERFKAPVPPTLK